MSENKLYVGNLSFQSTEDDVRNAFSAHGTVQSVALIMDRETGRPRGFAFVEMGSDAEAQAAVKAMDGRDLGGRNLKVNIAKPRESGGGGGSRGGYGGGGGGGYGGGSRGGRY
jgi:cold-inducible RNA-binding protein